MVTVGELKKALGRDNTKQVVVSRDGQNGYTDNVEVHHDLTNPVGFAQRERVVRIHAVS